MAEITTTERLPFPLAKPNPETFVTQASEIGHNGDPLGTTIDSMIANGYKFGGFVTPSSSPISGTEKYFYIATQNGTYINFGGVVLSDETAILYDTDSQHSTTAKCGQAICGYAICGTN